MNVWIDILHIPQFNFYKPFIMMLTEQGHHVYISALGRGKLPAIVKKELNGMENVSVSIVGKHRMTKWSVIIEANLIRIVWLFFWVCGKKIDVAFSNGSHVGMMGRLFRFPAYEFEDDPQAADYNLMCRFATQNHSMLYELPKGYTLNSKDKLLRCLKEWSYLNPRTFVPNVEALKQYGVKPKEYIFLREVSVGTINYAGQESGAILGIKELIPKDKKVLFSLEEKNRRNEYPADWILLQEPIEDIHSLIYYAAGLVSSGDSMAREAALMGIPSYYLGIRYTMPANAAASNVASLQNRQTMDFAEWIALLPSDVQECGKRQLELRKHIDESFIDINAYMMSLVESVDKK